ncbi:hypothetical protein C8R45DRAFT_930989 [Mycena sanguinolenta]|nr:hypothetical protein C8R45DRAFT_930989 [Mycena sanguinolenta]
MASASILFFRGDLIELGRTKDGEKDRTRTAKQIHVSLFLIVSESEFEEVRLSVEQPGCVTVQLKFPRYTVAVDCEGAAALGVWRCGHGRVRDFRTVLNWVGRRTRPVPGVWLAWPAIKRLIKAFAEKRASSNGLDTASVLLAPGTLRRTLLGKFRDRDETTWTSEGVTVAPSAWGAPEKGITMRRGESLKWISAGNKRVFPQDNEYLSIRIVVWRVAGRGLRGRLRRLKSILEDWFEFEVQLRPTFAHCCATVMHLTLPEEVERWRGFAPDWGAGTLSRDALDY